MSTDISEVQPFINIASVDTDSKVYEAENIYNNSVSGLWSYQNQDSTSVCYGSVEGSNTPPATFLANASYTGWVCVGLPAVNPK